MEQRKAEPVGQRFLTNVELWITGRWLGGGTAVVRDGEEEAEFDVPPQLFAVLAVLIIRARHDESLSKNKPWTSRGFLSAAEIQFCTRLFGGVRTERERIAKLIHRLRKKFARLKSDRGRPLSNAAKLIQNHKRLGYRISTRAHNLHLHIINDLPMTGTGGD